MNKLTDLIESTSDIMFNMISFTFPVMGFLIFVLAFLKLHNYIKMGREITGIAPMLLAGIFLFSAPNILTSIEGDINPEKKSTVISEKAQKIINPTIVKNNSYKKEILLKEKYVKKEVDINWKALLIIFGSIIGFIFSILIIISLITTISYFILKRKTLNFINIETNLLNVADNISLITEQINYNKKYIDNKILFQNKVKNLNEQLNVKYNSIEKYLTEQENKLVN